MTSSWRYHLVGEIMLDSGTRVAVKRHYGHAQLDRRRDNGDRGMAEDTFTVFSPSAGPSPHPGETGTLFLLSTVSRCRITIALVDRLGTELRIVGRMHSQASSATS